MLLDEPSNHLDIDATAGSKNISSSQPAGDAHRQSRSLLSESCCHQNLRVACQADHVVSRQLPAIHAIAPGALRTRVKGIGIAERIHREARGTHPSSPLRADGQEGPIAAEEALDKIERSGKADDDRRAEHAFRRSVRAGDVVFGCRTRQGLRQTSLQGAVVHLPRGKRLGIMGANGSGKTTLLSILLGEEDPGEGKCGAAISSSSAISIST